MTNTPFTTTQTGTPVPSDAHSLTAGTNGATALHDRYLVEKLAQFNRERIPERIVHAKGGGAFGEFVVTEDVSAYTRAAVFQPGTRTETLQRFSSVAGEQGSPDTWRDVRGFSVKFYTTEGNYDIVGNNTPVFFIRDGIKFPDFIHSQKRLPGSGLRDADMQWDFWTLSPESAHQVTYLMGDRGLPRSWREMPGFGSHTYQWINAAGERFWVKYHFTSNQGNVEMEGSEAELIAGADADYYRRDLYEAIEAGDFPSWDVHVQVMPYEDAKSYRFNPFDLTKVWPHADYPLIKVGTHTLNRNPQNFFAEIEQAAFSPANTVPGIDISPDKMLMARVFSYPDAQRYRVGTNYQQIPVNAPHAAPVHNYSQDGAQRHGFNAPSTPVYAPNSLGGPVADEARAGVGSWESDGELTRAAATLHAEDDDFGQAGTLYREVFDDAARARFLETITGAVGGVQSLAIRERAIQYWTNVDATLGAALRSALEAAPLAAEEPGVTSEPAHS
ncbi:catalase [Oerskovia turbata]|uniref:Catalase n=1 Tax=Oerskovia turbata TaxID=1713 RepID=A0A4Q1KZI7_9CELL|nr:catalase [Oerskovia turbata]RXR27781.1 catalase [Oerskovia turbata]RXR35782.1 catalase [Oerskovia turbata]TGJ96743.1 catalase [Actinotalea fermentans ATCC 43279 = JCM 9966 = DSM 3133]